MFQRTHYIDCPGCNISDSLCYYIDAYDNEHINSFFKDHYDALLFEFRSKGLELVYLPMLRKCIGQEVMGYVSGTDNAELNSHPENFKGVLPDVVIDRVKGPCIIHYDSIHERFEVSTFIGPAYDFPEMYAHTLIYEYSRSRKVTYIEDYLGHSAVAESLGDMSEPTRGKFSIRRKTLDDAAPEVRCCHREMKLKEEEDDEEDKLLDKENQKVIRKIKALMKELRDRGLSEEQLRILLRPNQKLSKLRVTKDYHFYLVDYDNKEVVMTPIQKALLLLYLKHPEGIPFKMLIDYKEELFNIYHDIDGWNHIRQHHRIDNLCDPLRNTINENVSRIRNAFRAIVDDSIACAYYITGKQGQEMRITIDRDMVSLE